MALLPYIRVKAEEIMTAKAERGVVPVGASALELVADVMEDTKECMRELHRENIYKASRTINHPLLLRIED